MPWRHLFHVSKAAVILLPSPHLSVHSVHTNAGTNDYLITFDNDKNFGLVDYGKIAQEGNRTDGKKWEASRVVIPTNHLPYFHGVSTVCFIRLKIMSNDRHCNQLLSVLPSTSGISSSVFQITVNISSSAVNTFTNFAIRRHFEDRLHMAKNSKTCPI